MGSAKQQQDTTNTGIPPGERHCIGQYRNAFTHG